MMRVTVACEHTALAAARRDLATMPETFTVTSGDARLQIVDGTDPLWPVRVGQHAGGSSVDAILVREPTAVGISPASIRNLEAGPAVILDLPWSGNHSLLEEGAPLLQTEWSAVTLVGTVSSRDALKDALVDALIASSLATGRAFHVRAIHARDTSVTAIAKSGDCPLEITIIASAAAAESATLTLLGAEETVSFDLPSPRTAQPATVRTVSQSGEHHRPSVYESSHRTALGRAASVIQSAATSAPDLARFAEAAEQASAFLSQRPTERGQ